MRLAVGAAFGVRAVKTLPPPGVQIHFFRPPMMSLLISCETNARITSDEKSDSKREDGDKQKYTGIGIDHIQERFEVRA